MAGYAGTPLSKKLGIKPDARFAQLNAPGGFVVQALPPGTTTATSLRGTRPFDVILLFTPDKKALTARFEPASRRLTEAGGLWIAWPKKSSGMATDLSDAHVRAFGLDAGLVDNKVCAIDETWSALRFVRRLRDRR